MLDDIEYRVMLARILREAGVNYDLIVEVLRASARAKHFDVQENSRVTDARRLMAATLRQREISNLPN